MTAPEVAGLILARARAAEYAAFSSGVDETRMQKARDWVKRFQDKDAMTALENEWSAITLFSTYDVACAHLAAKMPALSPPDDPTPVDSFDEDPADPTPLLDPRGAKR